MVAFLCPRCAQFLECPDEHAHEKAHCPRCQQRFAIPLPSHRSVPNDSKLNRTMLAPAVPQAIVLPERPEDIPVEIVEEAKPDKKKHVYTCPYCDSHKVPIPGERHPGLAWWKWTIWDWLGSWMLDWRLRYVADKFRPEEYFCPDCDVKIV